MRLGTISKLDVVLFQYTINKVLPCQLAVVAKNIVFFETVVPRNVFRLPPDLKQI
jgi:hypothetical protein